MTSSKKFGRNRLLILLAGAILMSLVLALSSAQTAKAAPTTPDVNGVERIPTPQAVKYTGQLVVQPTGMKVTVSPTPPAGNGPHPMDLPFGANVQVWNDAAEESRPSLAIYPNLGGLADGLHYLVFQHYNGADYDIHLAVSADGLTWITQPFAATPGTNEIDPSIAITSQGTVIVTWRDDAQPNAQPFAHSPDGNTFSGWTIDINALWTGDLTDIQYPSVVAQRNVGTYDDGIMLQGQAFCSSATNCGGGAHNVYWIGEQYANGDPSGWSSPLGGFYWLVDPAPGGTRFIVDPMHPSAWWGSADYTQVMDNEVTDGTEWELLWIYISEDGASPVSGWNSVATSSDALFGAGASDGMNAVVAGTYRKAADPSRHQIDAFTTTDGWATPNGVVPLDASVTNQRSISVSGVGTTFHITYYSNNVMTDMASTDTGSVWTLQKVSDNAGSAVNADRSTSVFIDYSGAPKVAWQDNRDGNSNIYTTGYITYPFWLNSTCGGSPSTMSLVIDDTLTIQTPYTARWSPGSTHTVRAPIPPQQDGSCKQCTFTQWQDGDLLPLKTIDVTGSFSLTAQFSAKYRVQLDTNPTGLQVIWKGLSHTAQYVTYESPQTYTADAPSPQNGAIPEEHYVFVDWSDGITTRTRNAVVGTTCLNLTANFGLEYQITIQTNPGGLNVGFDTTALASAPVTFWSASGVSHMLLTSSPQPPSPVDTRYRFDRWIGGPTTWGWNVTIPGANTYTANFITQYLIQIRANIESPGPTVGSDIPGCDVQMPAPLRCWADASSSPSLIMFTPQTSAGSRYVFLQWSDGDLRQIRPIGPIIEPRTYISMWSAEYYLTMVLDSNTCMGSVTPTSGWHVKGDPVNIDWVAPTGLPAGEQYRFWKWVGSGLGNYTGGSQSASVTMNDAITETAYCHHEFQTTLNTSPIALDYTVDTLVSANGLRTFWWEFMSVHWFNVTQTTQGGATTQYVFQDWSGNPNPNHAAYTVLSSNSFMANFQPQYKITLGQIPASPTGLGGLACSNVDCWYNEGAAATVSVTSPWPGVTDTQYVFSLWSGDASGISTSYTFSSMNAPKTATANWITQYKITVTTAHGTATCSNANCWYQAGTQASITLDSPADVTVDTRYVFTSWSGDASGTTRPLTITMDSPKTVTAGWQVQYKLTATSNCGTTACGDSTQTNTDGWYNAGAVATVTVTTPATVGDKTYDFTAWTGDSTATTAATTVTMDAPKSITATWTEKAGPSPASDLMVWIILIIVIIVVVALVLFLVMRRKKPPVEEELPPEEIPPAPPMRQAPPARPAAPAPAKPAPPAQRPVAPPPQKK
jgi:uncharacterized repeat protein (TIGR02543 family)